MRADSALAISSAGEQARNRRAQRRRLQMLFDDAVDLRDGDSAYLEERPKRILGGPTPSAYAKQLKIKTDTVNLEFQIRSLLKAGVRR